MLVSRYFSTIPDGNPVPNGVEVELRAHLDNSLVATTETQGGWATFVLDGNPVGPHYLRCLYNSEVHIVSSMATGVSATTDVGNLPLFIRTYADGYVRGVLGEVAVTAPGSAMTVMVASGAAYVRGVLYDQRQGRTLALAAPDAQPRIDRIIVQVVPPGGPAMREGRSLLMVKKGTPASSPVVPSLTQTTDLYEMALADVRVNPGVAAITQSAITDRRAVMAPYVPDSGVTTDKIADGSLTTPKLANSAVTESKIGENAVTATKIAPNAVTASQIAAGAVNTGELADKSVTADKIANSTITTTQVAPGGINGDRIIANTITGVQIAAGAVSLSELKDDAVWTSHLHNLAVTTEKLAAGAVTNAKIANDAINGYKIADNSIGNEHILNGQVFWASLSQAVQDTINNAANTGGGGSGVRFVDINFNGGYYAGNWTTPASLYFTLPAGTWVIESIVNISLRADSGNGIAGIRLTGNGTPQGADISQRNFEMAQGVWGQYTLSGRREVTVSGNTRFDAVCGVKNVAASIYVGSGVIYLKAWKK